MHLGSSPTVEPQALAFLTEMLRVDLTLVRNIQSIRHVKGSLFVGVDHNVTLNTGLRGVGPAVAAHPLPLTLWTLVLPKTSLLALVGCQPLPLGSGLRAVSDEVTFGEA